MPVVTLSTVTDIIELARVLKDLYTALDEIRGSTAEYQDVAADLRRFSVHMQAVEEVIASFPETASPHVVALKQDIKGWTELARKWQLKFGKYEKTLGTVKGKILSKRTYHKDVWYLRGRPRVAKFRTELEAAQGGALLQFMAIIGDMLLWSFKDTTNRMDTHTRELIRTVQQIAPIVVRGEGNSFGVTDALGKRLVLPTEHFKNWDLFHHLLQVHFRGENAREAMIGHSFVQRGDYIMSLVLTRDQGDELERIIRPPQWTLTVTDGAEFTMTIAMNVPTGDVCPRCGSLSLTSPDEHGWRDCPRCEGRSHVSMGEEDIIRPGNEPLPQPPEVEQESLNDVLREILPTVSHKCYRRW